MTATQGRTAPAAASSTKACHERSAREQPRLFAGGPLGGFRNEVGTDDSHYRYPNPATTAGSISVELRHQHRRLDDRRGCAGSGHGRVVGAEGDRLRVPPVREDRVQALRPVRGGGRILLERTLNPARVSTRSVSWSPAPRRWVSPATSRRSSRKRSGRGRDRHDRAAGLSQQPVSRGDGSRVRHQ